MEKCKFFLITDTHFYKNSLGARGKEYDEFMRFEQKCFAETQAINESVFAFLKSSDYADTVLIAGDLSFNGEMESHLEFIKHLKDLRSSGKKVFVITADHDFKNEDDSCFSFDENGRGCPKAAGRDELFDLYRDFGFDDALAVDRQHLSYVAQLCDGVRLLALNNDGSDTSEKYFDSEQISWIKQQAEKASAEGEIMFAMNHYPLLPGQPLFSIIPTAVQKNGDSVSRMLADLGVNLVFTGHMHNQSINKIVTDKGNVFYDVCTGSIIAHPAVIRLVEIGEDKKVTIKSIDTPDFDWDTGSVDCKTYLCNLFDSMILNIIEDMKDDPQRLMSKFGIKENAVISFVFKTAGKLINKITLGTMCRMLFIKCPGSVGKIKVKDYAVELVRGVFEGNQGFVEGTDKGDVFLSFLKRINPILKKVNVRKSDGSKADLYDILKNTAGNYDIDDYNAVLDLNPVI